MEGQESTQTTPDEGNIDLDAAVQEGLQRFEETLSQAAESGEETPEGPATTAEDEPEHPTGGQESDKGERQEPESPGDAASYRFRSHEEAEEGYRNLQGKFTRLEERLSRIENASQAQEEASRQAQEEASRQAQEEAFLTFAEEREKQALDAIDELDPDEDDYQARIARINAEKARDIRNWQPEQQQGEPPAPPPAQSAAPPATEDEATAAISQAMEKAGIDPEDPVFWTLAEKVPTKREDGTPMTFEDRIHWTVQRTQNTYAAHDRRKQEETEQQAREKGLRNQEETQPLGRTGTGPTETPGGKAGAEKPPKPVTLDDAISSALESRRL